MNGYGVTRRTFLKSASALGGAVSIGLLSQESWGDRFPTRSLGRTGLRVPILGLGTAPLGYGLSPSESERIIETALDLGVTYIDTAYNYAHAQQDIGRVMKRRRDQAFLVTKTHTTDGTTARLQLEESLRQLQTDHLDLVHVHSIGGLDIDKVLAPGGTLETLLKAKERGLTKFIGVTSHNSPEKVNRMIETNLVDVMMVPINTVDRDRHDFEKTCLPLAESLGVGVIAMKVFGGAKHTPPGRPNRANVPEDQLDSALGYSLGSQAVSCAVIGMCSEKELWENVERVNRNRVS